MRKIKSFSRPFYVLIFILFPLLLLKTTICQAQLGCEEILSTINQTYSEGNWSSAKTNSLYFIRSIHSKGKQAKISGQCKDNISKVYYYLIQSYLRLYNLDSAKFYYFQAIKNEHSVDIDPTDKNVFETMGSLKKHSLNFYIGIISSDIREMKLGVGYGLTSDLFIEASFNNRHFNHLSGVGDGVLGKPMDVNPAVFPNYIFKIQGYERYFEVSPYYKWPVPVSRKEVNVFYISIGPFATYYLNSHVNNWNLTKNDISQTNSIDMPNINNRRYLKIDTFGINMDLKRKYSNRINYGIFMNLGSSINLRGTWQIFFEIKFAVGKNNRYAYHNFSSYKPGVDYFFLVIGLTKKLYKIKEIKK